MVMAIQIGYVMKRSWHSICISHVEELFQTKGIIGWSSSLSFCDAFRIMQPHPVLHRFVTLQELHSNYKTSVKLRSEKGWIMRLELIGKSGQILDHNQKRFIT